MKIEKSKWMIALDEGSKHALYLAAIRGLEGLNFDAAIYLDKH